jgi:hypothetical protein
MSFTQIQRAITGMFFFACCTISQAYSQQSNPHQQQAMVLRRALEKSHYSPRSSDNTLSSDIFHQFLHLLDEEGLYFTFCSDKGAGCL